MLKRHDIISAILSASVYLVSVEQIEHRVKKEVKQSRYRPGVAQRVPGS
jgi:hypothetical protein